MGINKSLHEKITHWKVRKPTSQERLDIFPCWPRNYLTRGEF